MMDCAVPPARGIAMEILPGILRRLRHAERAVKMLVRATSVARQLKLLIAAALVCTSMAQAAGLQLIEAPADADEPPMTGAVRYPCTATASQVKIGLVRLEATKDCPVAGSALPLIVISHD